MPLYSSLRPIYESPLQLGVSVALKLPSAAFEELDNYRKSKYSDSPWTENLTQWTHPLIYYGIQGKYRKNIHHEFSSTVSSFGQFDVELIPHYSILSRANRRFLVGFKFQHEVLQQIKLAFSRWGGEGISHDDDDVLQSSTNHRRLGTSLFYPIQVIETEDEIQVEHAIRELSNLLGNFGNTFMADSLLLQEYWSSSDGTPKYSSTLAAYQLKSSKNQLLQGLSKLRMLAFKEEVINNHNQRIASTYAPRRIVTRDTLRVIMSVTSEIQKKRKIEATEFHPGLLRKVISKSHVPRGPLHYTNNIAMPTLGNQIRRFKNKRFVQRVPTNLRSFNPERELIVNPQNSSRGTTLEVKKFNVNLSSSLLKNSILNLVPRCTRQKARHLERKKRKGPLIRYGMNGLVIRYKCVTFSLPVEKYKCYIRHISPADTE